MVDTKSCRCCPRKSKSRVPLRTLIPEGSAVIGASGGTLHGPEVPEGDHQQKKLPHGAQALDLTSVPSTLHEPARKEAWMFWLLQEYMRGACQNPRNFCRRKKRRPGICVGISSARRWCPGTMENTIGDVPIQWFRDEEHIGYDADGRRILKRARIDHLDHLLQMVDDPTYWRKVFDEREDKEIAISKEQVRDGRVARGGGD